MVASFASAASLRGQSWTYLVRIAGIGDYDGQHTWSINAPDFVGTSDNRYLQRDTLASVPRITPERTKSMLGGMPEAGSATVELVDYRDLITSARRTDAPAVDTLSSAMSATDSSIIVNTGTAIPSSQTVVWIGAEAVRISSRSGTTLTVAASGRGYLGTDAASHAAGDAVYLTCPFLRSRRMTIYLAPQDADSDTVATTYAIGTYRIDSCKLGSQLGTWVLSGPTEVRDLGRLVASRVPAAFRVRQVYRPNNGGDSEVSGFLIAPVPGSRFGVDVASLDTLRQPWPDDAAFYRVDETKEVLRVDAGIGSGSEPYIAERGMLGTDTGALNEGDIIRPVLVSDATYGSFRWSPGPTPSTSRSSGTWTVSQHPVDMLLCLLTSSASRDDGLELTNYVAAHGNWSSLPPGFGIGYSASRIDWSSFLVVRARYASIALPAVVLGDQEPQTFAEWATRNILEPMGWFLVVTGGLLTLVAPQVLLSGDTPDAELDEDSIVEVGEPEESFDLVAGSVTYRYRGTHGETLTTTVRSSDFTGLFGGRAAYAGGEDEPALIELPGVIGGGRAVSALLTLMAQRRLMRAVRAPWRVPIVVDSSFHALTVGQTVSITHNDLPDLNTGTRGWTDVLGQITAATPVHLDDRNRCVRTLTVLVYPSFRAARIGPSAIITAVTGTGPWTCTVRQNRYTSTDGDDYLSVSGTDGEAFTVDDVVRTIDVAGVDVTSEHTVTAVAADELELTGGSAAPSVGDVIVYERYTGATTTQRSRFAAWCDSANLITTGVSAVLYGEA